jgi:hypothetical protein
MRDDLQVSRQNEETKTEWEDQQDGARSCKGFLSKGKWGC